jgi:hypothetical protein
MTDGRVCNLTEVLGIAKICLFPCRLACAVQSKTHICLTEIFSFQAQTFDAQSQHVTEPEFMAGTWHGFFDVFSGHQGDGRQAALSARLWSLSMSDQRCGRMAQLQS